MPTPTNWALIRHTQPHTVAPSRTQPRTVSDANVSGRLVLAGQRRFALGLEGWGGWGSNPGPADYESAALTG
jgi:hypothetical protein